MLYRWLRALLFRLPAERAHRVAFGLLRALLWLAPLRALLRRWWVPSDAALVTRTLGLTLPSPVGLAAGFDKDAEGPDALLALGFGAVEVGTVTARPQPGNPEPRLFRLPADRALINRMGFNNAGAEAMAARLQARAGRPGVVGVNLGKSKVVPDEEAVADYVASARRLGPLADYVVVNVSSPNTPGLRDLQAESRLRPLLVGVQEALEQICEGRPPPLLVKIAPDLDDAGIDAVAGLALELGLAGIVATNTTIGRTGLCTPAAELEAIGAGGLSGAPLKTRALEVLRRLRRRVGNRLVLVAAGGIETADDAWERLRAGASLVQLYTAFVYEGPGLARRIALGLAERARRDGFDTVSEAVGSDLSG